MPSIAILFILYRYNTFTIEYVSSPLPLLSLFLLLFAKDFEAAEKERRNTQVRKKSC